MDTSEDSPTIAHMPKGFDYLSNIDPSIIQSVRYATKHNFVGEPIDGYKAEKIIISKKAGICLSMMQREIKQFGFQLVVYDAYRPQKAVDHFVRWAKQMGADETKSRYFPNIDKADLFAKKYIYEKSGHTRGGTVDLTIIPIGQQLKQIQVVETTLNNGQNIQYNNDGTVFMQTHWDFFGQASHQNSQLISKECLEKRELLKNLMVKHGFKEVKEEWWHFTLAQEPFPDQYFDFDII